MFRKRLKMFSLIIMVTMVFSVLSACVKQDSSDKQPGTTTQNQETSTQPEPKGPVTLELYNTSFRNEDVDPDNLIMREIEKRTNTKLKIIQSPPGEAEEKLNITLAAGERPDIITMGTGATENKLAEAGLLLPLNKHFDKMPNLEKSRGKAVWDAMTHKDGNIYAIPSTTEAPATYVTIYRKDWLDKLGLSIPTTLDEYYEVANAVSNKDPNGSGKKDTYAFGARGSLGSYFDHIFSAFGFLPNYWMEKDGELVSGDIAPEAKDALKFCKKMYDEGMIDPEFTTDSSSRLTEKTYKGTFGAFHFGLYILDSQNIYGHHNKFKEMTPDGELVAGPLFEGPGGKFGHRQDISIKGWIMDSIISETKELDACLRLVDFLASDEGTMLMNYGIEGQHYTMDKSSGVLTNLIDQDQAKTFGVNQLVLVSKSTFNQTSSYYRDTLKMLNANSTPNAIDGMGHPDIPKHIGEVKDLLYSSFFKMMTGEIAIEGGFEEYVKKWKQIGGNELTKIVNDEYKQRK